MALRHPWAHFEERGGWNLKNYSSQIRNKDLQTLVEIILSRSSMRFWIHFRHYDAVCQVGLVILDALKGSEIDYDVVLAGCILHDIGLGKNHEEEGAKWVRIIAEEENLMSRKIHKVCNCIRKHSGRWGREKPKTKEEWVVHLSDYIASHLLA